MSHVDVRTMKAIILAGGFGTRLRTVLPDIPKPMAPVAGRPFLEWILRYLSKQGIARAIISAGYLSAVVEQHFARVAIPGISISCIPETKPLGTAGALAHAAKGASERAPIWLVM